MRGSSARASADGPLDPSSAACDTTDPGPTGPERLVKPARHGGPMSATEPPVVASAGASGVRQERQLVTAIPGPRSIELLARRNAAVAAGVSVMLPVFITRAGGGILVDVDGNHLIDLGAGIAVTSVGNANPEVAAAVAAQATAFTHTCFMVTPYEGYVAVCEALNRLTPGAFEKRSALFNSGAEAVENAVKIARAYTGRQAVVVFDHGYHGRTN